jgi:hypothetical protein
MIAISLHRLSIRSSVVAGAVSWRFGGRGPDGAPVEFRGGYLTSEPGQAPHYWVETEFGELVDLACSFFPLALSVNLASFREHDIIPPIWARREVLSRLPSVRYETGVRYWGGVDLTGSDRKTRRAIATAEESFAAIPRSIDDDDSLLGDAQSLQSLLAENTWVRRNSCH